MAAPSNTRRNSTRVRISKSGQITLPAKIRKKLGVDAGEYVEFAEDESGAISVRPSKIMTLEEIAAKARPLPAGEDLEEVLRDARMYGNVRERYRTGSIYDDID